MIAYHFPPEGNAGAYRPLRFVRQLPKLGWIPSVVSAIPSQYERNDPALVRMIPPEIEVIRVKAYDLWQAFQASRSRRIQTHSSPSHEHPVGNKLPDGQQNSLRNRLRELVRTAEAYWYHPDMAMPWIAPAVEATVKLCQRKHIDAIWATAGPVSSLVVAKQCSVKTGIPYILDFRDAWTLTYNAFEARQPRWAKRRARHTMYKLLNGARAVIFRYEAEAECFWRAYSGALDSSKIHIIPNGFEPPIEEAVFPTGEKCTILYAGTLPDYRYDTLFRSLISLKEVDPARATRLRLLFVGEGMESLKKEAAAVGLTDIVETMGPKSYEAIMKLQREAHALLVLGRKSRMKGYELFAAAKLFGYLKAGRPIVGVLPDDETKNVLRRVGACTVADVDSVPDITNILQLIIDHWCAGSLSSLAPDAKACDVYSSEYQTATLASALEGLPAKAPFVPGAQVIPPSLRGIECKKWFDGEDS